MDLWKRKKFPASSSGQRRKNSPKEIWGTSRGTIKSWRDNVSICSLEDSGRGECSPCAFLSEGWNLGGKNQT